MTPRLGLIHRPHRGLPRLAARMQLDAIRAPEHADWHGPIEHTLGDPLGNDVHGNCVACGALRRIQMARAITAHDDRVPTAAQALALYRAWGWDGTEANDFGLASDDAAARWATEGVEWGPAWLDIPSIVAVDPQLLDHVRAAIALLGPVQVDVALPRSVQGATVWQLSDGPDAAPGSWGSHRVCVGRYDGAGFTAISWGIEIEITLPFFLRYALGVEATVCRTWLNTTGLSPTGLDLAALEADARLLAA